MQEHLAPKEVVLNGFKYDLDGSWLIDICLKEHRGSLTATVNTELKQFLPFFHNDQKTTRAT